MVSSAYLLDKPRPQNPTAMLVNQHVVPRLIDAAAVMETVAERVSTRMRVAPTGPLAAAFCAGALLALLVQRGRSRNVS